jgi:uncharacterized protein (DUF697 family)
MNESHPPTKNNRPSRTHRLANQLTDRLARAIDETDEVAAAARVAALRQANPDANLLELADILIKNKCGRTAAVGATTSAVAVVPGLGTISSLALGLAADIGITFKMQAELVLEIAALYDHNLAPDEKRRVVLFITGLSAGATTLAHRAGQGISARLLARTGSRYIARGLPFIGMAASAATNYVLTYAIGQRAKAYFTLGPEAMRDWRSSAKAIVGVNDGLLESGKQVAHTVGTTAVTPIKKAKAAIANRRRKP